MNDGKFLEQIDITSISKIRSFMVEEMKELLADNKQIDYNNWKSTIDERKNAGYDLDKSDIIFIYENLMKYRTRMENLLNSNYGFLYGALFNLYPVELVFKCNSKAMKEILPFINKSLSIFISPNQIEFTREELIEKFDYDDMDISQIDNEYL